MRTISKIAFSNDKRNRTRSVLIMTAICLTTMLLVIISTIGNGMIRLQKSQAASSYGSNYGLFIAADGTQLKEVERRAEISDIGIMCTEGILKGNENGGFVSADETVRKMLPYSMIEEIKSIPGVTDVMTREIVSVNLNGTRFPADIVSKKDFDFMRQEGDIGSMDYDQAVKNGDIFFGWSTWMEQDGYAPGESIAFDFENGSGTYTYQGKIAGSFVSADTYLVIPEGVYRSMNPRGTAYGYLWVDCDKKDVASVEQSLNTLISNTSHIKMDTYHAQLQYAEYTSRMMKLGCYLFMAIVGLIGFMNLANTMIINITTKKQEYGVLQAVGMTNKQLNLCLQLQGLIFTVGTICVALIIGLPLGYALFSYAKHNGIFGMNIYHVPIVPIFIMIFLVGLLQIVLSCVLSSNLKKETLVERIRYQG